MNNPARQLSDAEIIAIAAEHCGINARCWAKYTEPFLVADDPTDPEEIRIVEWSYENRVSFLLQAAQHGPRPH
jgi:hypothetical protein